MVPSCAVIKGRHFSNVFQYIRADLRMGLYYPELLIGKLALFVDDIVGNTYLTDIMQHAHVKYPFSELFVLAHFCGYLFSVFSHTVGMTLCIRILCVYGFCKGLYHLKAEVFRHSYLCLLLADDLVLIDLRLKIHIVKYNACGNCCSQDGYTAEERFRNGSGNNNNNDLYDYYSFKAVAYALMGKGKDNHKRKIHQHYYMGRPSQ